MLPHEGGVVVIGLIGADLRANESGFDEMLGDDLQGLSVLFLDEIGALETEK